MKSKLHLRTKSLFCFFVLVSSIVLFSIPNALAQISPPSNIDSYIEEVRSQFNVPGIGLAIVKDGEVVTAKGYGIREIGRQAPVNAQTLFGIASNSKAFTATALGILVEEGKIEWDAPVIKYLPGFKLSDPYVTREITVRDLLVHRSGLGLGAGDLLWWPGTTYSREEIVHRLRNVPLASSFRSAYAYDNVLYMVAGEVIEAVSGKSWEDFVATRILEKIGMKDSNVLHSDAAEGPNAATPHAFINGVVQTVHPFTSDVTNPAGGINASARDMAKWLSVQLDSGRVDLNTRLFTPQTTRLLWSVVTPMPINSRPPSLDILEPQFKGYGLGFILRDYRGRKIVTHTGSLPGYVSKVTMIPELKLGVAVLTNQESRSAYKAITYHILDHYLKAPNKDWIAAFKKADKFRQVKTDLNEEKITFNRNSTINPSLPVHKYAGTYTDSWYGDIIINKKDDGGLLMRFSHTPLLIGDMEHWQHNTFIVRWHNQELRADAFITFTLDSEGNIKHAKMKAVSPATDFSYDFQHLLLKPASQK